MPRAARSTDPARQVFVNCPFDKAYLPLFHALLFTIHDCGFVARTALESTGAAELRLEKIIRLIGESRLSIHDLSRVKVTRASPYPRFNMPFEAGLAYGASRYSRAAEARARDLLILEAVPYQDHVTTSDLAGQDSKIHGNEPERMVRVVRDFLASKDSEPTRGAAAIWTRFGRFKADLPKLASSVEITVKEIRSLEYLRDWLAIMAAWVRSKP